MQPRPKTLLWALALLAALSLAGCATTRIETAATPHPDRQAVWAVLAPVNNTSTPYAGGRVQQQLAAILGAKGVEDALIVPTADKGGPLPLDNGSGHTQQGLAWAREHHARYALLGSVDEWRYKIGLDGQPAVGFTLRLIDLQSGKTLWSGAASASGGSREGLAVLSQATLTQLVDRLLQ